MLPVKLVISGATSLRGLIMLGKGKFVGSLLDVVPGSCTNFDAEETVSAQVDCRRRCWGEMEIR